MQALVTGGSGFIGSGVIEALRARGIKVRALLRKTSPRRYLDGLDFEPAIGDLSDAASLEGAVAGVDYVFHIAGAVWARNRHEFQEHNALGTARLAEAVAKVNPGLKRFVYVSSVAASGPSLSLTPLNEECVPAPISDYGESKLQGERELARILPTTPLSILRPPPVYGPRDQAVFQFIKIVNKNIIPVLRAPTPDGEKYYNFIHVNDLVDMIVAAGLTQGLAQHEMFFAVNDEVYSWSQIMETVARALNKKRLLRVPVALGFLKGVARASSLMTQLTGHRFELDNDKFRQMEANYYVYSNQRARDLLGFRPKFSLEEGMVHTVNWYRQHKWL